MRPVLKNHWQELAVWGGPPAFAEPLHVGRPNVGNNEAALCRFRDALDRRWLTNDGPYVQELETRLAELCKVDFCVAVANGTLALELAASVLIAGPSTPPHPRRKQVLMPSLTFIATAHAFRWRGLEPRFVDIDRQSLTICPQQLAKAIDDRTAAVCGVHLFGRVCDVPALERVAAVAEIPLMFDASHALANEAVFDGATRVVGQSGRLETFSLHATKFVGCGEGGAIATNDEQIAGRLRAARNFGYVDGAVAALGTNAKMSELSAAMGLSSLEQMDRFLLANRRNYEAYRDALLPVRGVTLRRCDPTRQNCQYIVVEVECETGMVSRDELLRVLRAENVLARPYFSPPCHQQPPYSHSLPAPPLPNTNDVSAKLIALPTGECVSERDITAMARIIELAQARSARAA